MNAPATTRQPEEDRKYDVAISLRWTDVEHARALYSLLQDRLDVFFADEKQEDFVGTDGEESFGYIFRDHARIVVVFYRPDWGETTFTRAEESAIKQRAHREGYGFTIWVPMGGSDPPPYLPPQQIWFDFEQYEIEGLAAVVEERVRESGLEVRAEQPTDRLRRIQRRIDLESDRRSFEGGMDGVNFVRETGRRLSSIIEQQLQKYRAISSDVRFKTKEVRQDELAVTSWPLRCHFHLYRYAKNTARGAYLAAYFKRHKQPRGGLSEWVDTHDFKFEPTLDGSGEPAWRLGENDYYSTKGAVAHALNELAEKAYLQHEKELRDNR